MIDVAAALGFVAERGSALERARLRSILYGDHAAPEVVHALTGLQNADGGFPLGLAPGRPSALDPTCQALWWLDELGLLGSPPAERALAHLLAAMKDDGGVDEDAALAAYGLPPWIRPGELYTRLYLSAYLAYWLAIRGCQADPAFGKVAGFLVAHQEGKGRLSGYLNTTWLSAAAMLMAGPAHAHAAERALQALAAMPLGEWEPSNLAWALCCLGRAAMPRGAQFAGRAVPRLQQMQRPDGSFSSEDAPDRAVDATVEVLRALRLFGAL